MERQEYKKLKSLIESQYNQRRVKLESEYRADLEALERVRTLSSRNAANEVGQGASDIAGDDSRHISKSERVKGVIPLVEDDEITQPKVMSKVREVHPDLAFVDPTVVTKALRACVKDGTLIEVRKAQANRPAVFKKVTPDAQAK